MWYCEHVCPSRDITTTPRRRIVARRELKRLELSGNRQDHKLLLNEFKYDVLDTCAVDGLCANACPVDINTGDLVKKLRRENHSSLQNSIALLIAKNFGITEFFVRAGITLRANRLFSNSRLMKFVGPVPAIPKSKSVDADVIYFPSCVSRMMGTGVLDKKNLMETFISVCEKAGLSVSVPRNINGSCCSQIFSSKGYMKAYQYKANDIIDRLWKVSRNGKTPVVTDVSSCAYTLQLLRPVLSANNKMKFDGLQMLDSVEFLHDMVMPVVKHVNKKENIVLHPVCSLEKMGTWQKFVSIAHFFANNVTIPANAGCCGMAGDRGFIVPELTASATEKEAAEVKQTGLMGIILLQKPVKLPCRMQLGWNMKEFCTWQMSVYKRQRGEGRGRREM
jgi:D-lactate dehydrogenase